MTRRKFTTKFKTKVVLESLKEQSSLAELAQKYDLHLQQFSNWKKEFLQKAESVFDNGAPSTKSEAEQEKDPFGTGSGEYYKLTCSREGLIEGYIKYSADKIKENKDKLSLIGKAKLTFMSDELIEADEILITLY